MEDLVKILDLNNFQLREDKFKQGEEDKCESSNYGFPRKMIVVFTITLLTMSTTPTMVSPPSPGVIPAGIANLVQLTYLGLDSTTVSGTCVGVPLPMAGPSA